MKNFTDIFKRALSLHKKGDLQKAKQLYEELLHKYPDNHPDLYNILFNLVLINSRVKDFVSALKYAQKAYSIKPSDIDLLLQIASIYDSLGMTEEMIFYLEKAVELKPDNEALLLKLGISYTKIENKKMALFSYDRCLKLNENNLTALINLSAIASKAGYPDIAIKYAQKADNLSPLNMNVKHVLFLAYFEKKDWDNAVLAAKDMINTDCKNDLGFGCLAQVYFEAVDYSLALEFYEKALQLKPFDTDYIHNKCCCLTNLNRKEEALKFLYELKNSADKNSKVYTESSISICSIKLKEKRYLDAKDEYLYLMFELAKNNKKEIRFKEYSAKNWNDEDLKDKTLLIYNNQGFGDYLMFSRYIPLLKNIAGKIKVETPENLYTLFKNNFQDAEIILEEKELCKTYDYSAPVASLLYKTGCDLDNIPFSSGYIKADEKLTEQFSKYDIFNTEKIKTGIFWRGNPKILKNRAIKFDELIPLFEENRFSFYSLDIVKKDEKILKIMKDNNITDCAPYIKTFNDTAAVLKNLDLLITVDSSPMNLAGAMGVKTFLMLPENSEWRWFYDTKSTPWYDSVLIFKQKHQSDWDYVVNEIKKELQKL